MKDHLVLFMKIKKMAGPEGFEPSHEGVKERKLT